MSIDAREPLYVGFQKVHAIWFDPALIGETASRARILARWQPGASLYRLRDGYLLILARPCMARCAELGGVALCEQQGRYASAPLQEADWAGAPAGGYWLVHGARAERYQPLAGDFVDPARWLDLSGVVLREPLTVPGQAVASDPGPPGPPKPLRDILGDAIAPPSSEREQFLRELQESGASGAKGMMAAAGDLLGMVAIGAVAMVVGAFAPLLRRTGGAGGAGTAKGEAPLESPWRTRLANLAQRLAVATRVAHLLGRRQGAYMRKMLGMFEDGDILNALRHAIPLNRFESKLTRQALSTPGPRSRLDITDGTGPTASISLGVELHAYLLRTYRRAFEKLDREGRVDEAVFVLAELLGAGMEAVTYLETKGRHRQAAELAETLALPAATVVRLWWLAGDHRRAAQVGSVNDAWGEAVLLLERSNSAEAASLRLRWAEHLASRGDLLDAAEALWPLVAHREQAGAWLVQAEQAGGTLGMRAMLRKLLLQPDTLASSASALEQLLQAEGTDGQQRRARLATELLSASALSPATRRVAAALLPTVIAECLAGANTLQVSELKKLTDLCDTFVLRADLPPLKMPPERRPVTLAARAAPLEVSMDEKGLLRLQDVRRLADGQYLLALGEGGVVRVGRDGRHLAHFPIPAQRLVLAASGLRALAIVHRDKTLRVSRLDLLTGKASDWVCQPISHWAEDFDGVSWDAVIERRLVAIDTTRDQLSIMWQVADLPGPITDFARDAGGLSILMATGEGMEHWHYRLPARQLGHRHTWPKPPDDATIVLRASAKAPDSLRFSAEGAERYLEYIRGGTTHGTRLTLGASKTGPQIASSLQTLLVVAMDDDCARCSVLDADSGSLLATLRLPGADTARARLDSGHALLFDYRGRLVDLDCASGQVAALSLR